MLPTLQHHRRLLCYINLLCQLCNITEGCSALPALQHHRGLLCAAYSATSHRVALRYLLYNITEGCSTLAALLCLLCNITEHTLLFVDHTYSLQRDPISLQWVFKFAKLFYQQLKSFLNNFNTLQVMLCYRHKLHLPCFQSLPLLSVKCFTPSVRLMGALTTLYNQVHFINFIQISH